MSIMIQISETEIMRFENALQLEYTQPLFTIEICLLVRIRHLKQE